MPSIGDPSSRLGTLPSPFAQQREAIRAAHLGGASGRQIVSTLSDLTDDLVTSGLQQIDLGLMSAWGGALVAIGGYGRGEISPHSDIDLLFLSPPDQTQSTGAISAALLCFLWDTGLRVGHSLRTVEDCLATARHDPIIATSMLEARRIAGNPTLFAQFQKTVLDDVAARCVSFLRHLQEARPAASACALEPNVKQGPGGLRDLHRIRWAALARFRVGTFADLCQRGLLSKTEQAQLEETQDFLWRVRNQLHFQFGASDHLMVDTQEEIAPALGFENRRDFMRHYYLQTDRVLDLSRRFLRQAMPVGPWTRWKRWWNARTLIPGVTLADNEISATPEVCQTDAGFMEILRQVSDDTTRIADAVFDAMAWRAAKPGLLSAAAIALFRERLAQPEGLANALQAMHRTRLLWKMIPEFSHVAYLVPESRTHAFTVDEHTLRAVDEATRLLADPGPLGTVYREIRRKDLLHLALLLHDIGKGQDGDHSAEGMRIATEVVRRLGYPKEDMEHVLLLVHRHLLFSEVAFYRDFSNEPVLLQFVREVGQPEALRHLLILTCADMRAVAPGLWNDWKGTLLLKLYQEALHLLSGEVPDPDEKKVQAVLAQVAAAAHGQYPQAWLDEALPALSHRYLLSTPLDRIAADLAALFQMSLHPIQVTGRSLSNGGTAESGLAEYTLYTDDRLTAGIFYKMTGVLAARGIQILSAQVATHANGMVIDVFQVCDPDSRATPERIAAIAADVRAVLRGEQTVEALMSRYHRFAPAAARPLPASIRVAVDNDSSRRFTVIDVFAPDRRGLLYRMARTLFDLGLSVHGAIISTQMDQIVDVFYVLGQDQKKIVDPAAIHTLKADLTHQIEAFFSGANTTLSEG